DLGELGPQVGERDPDPRRRRGGGSGDRRRGNDAHYFPCSGLLRIRRKRAGHPATTAPGSTLRVTTAPAPTRAPSPITTPAMTTAPLPTDAPRHTRVGTSCQSAAVCGSPSSLVARGSRSLMNITPWPTNTSSSIVTPEQTNVWLDILHRAPALAPAWTSSNAPIRLSSPTRHPYRVAKPWIAR